MGFYYKNSFAESHALEGYEHLILLAMVGDQSLFTRSDGIERRVADLRTAAGEPAAGRALSGGSCGPESVQQADRALPLAPAPSLGSRAWADSDAGVAGPGGTSHGPFRIIKFRADTRAAQPGLRGLRTFAARTREAYVI